MKNIQSLEQRLQCKQGRNYESDHHIVFLRGMERHWPNGRCNPYSGRGDTSTPWRMLLLEHERTLARPVEDSQIRK